ncbi:hypothetical protein WOLCODRAFT_131675 [Wolfiporia cocos MD-104 SS10]|uniref:DUF7702 domain-containing protein n=1 Tax=Wolfiporia cocos (strain MD-104) TaxID=742152 RepID=A0A2H3JTA2_WOLCO|nr:hypothetical protein WOLCODRAFT_131675 [Wolfiporia cocos MD-104 SS10]
MALDPRGDIAIAEIVVYVCVLVLSVLFVIRHGWSREVGWTFLSLFSASELRDTCDGPLTKRALQLLGMLGTIAVVLDIIGSIQKDTATTQSALAGGKSFREASAILFAILYTLVFAMHALCWVSMRHLSHQRRKLLAGISLTLPFLSVRIAYTVLSAYAPSEYSINDDGSVTFAPSHSPIEQFGESGSWAVYLVMSVIMEWAVVLIHMVVGLQIQPEDGPQDKTYTLPRPRLRTANPKTCSHT